MSRPGVYVTRAYGTSDYLRIPAGGVGPLNLGASTGAVTVAAWVYSTDTNAAMIAGCWQETPAGGIRSYGLFNDLPTYGGDDRVCMHVSKTGGATPGYPHSIDYAVDPRSIARGRWQLHVGTYDGAQAIAYLDGAAEPYPSYTDSKGATYAKNPYAFGAGLNAAASEFLVGASLRNGAPINLHRGTIARLRVWDRALTAEQIAQLYQDEKVALDPPPGPEIPAAVASWEFGEAAPPYASSIPGSPALRQGPGSTARRVATPFGGGVEFNGTDGAQAIAYLDGLSSSYSTYTDNKGATYAKNPYLHPDGLNATPVDFNVGAVVRDASLINPQKGRVARLRVWDVAPHTRTDPRALRVRKDGARLTVGLVDARVAVQQVHLVLVLRLRGDASEGDRKGQCGNGPECTNADDNEDGVHPTLP